MQTIYKKYDKTLNEEIKNVCAVEIEKHGRWYLNGKAWNGEKVCLQDWNNEKGSAA